MKYCLKMKTHNQKNEESQIGYSRLLLMSGLLLLVYSIGCKIFSDYDKIDDDGYPGVVVSVLHLESCPRHPLMSIWLLVMAIFLSLMSLYLMISPVCQINTSVNTSNIVITRCTVILLFVSTLLSIFILLFIVSWISVATFWIASTDHEMFSEVSL